MDELEEYREAVEYYAAKKINYLLFNKGDEHAKIILENIFKNANSIIRIAARSLSNEVASNDAYINSLTEFLNKPKTELRIFLSDTDFDLNTCGNRKLWNAIIQTRAFSEERIVVKKARDERFFKIKNDEGKSSLVHFTTADGFMYRLETDIVLRTARCNFNDKTYTKLLDDLYDNNFNDGVDVALAPQFD